MAIAVVFPGQGSQFIGMGKDLADAFPVAKEVFQEVDEVLHQKLYNLMTEGAESDLNLTENTQPALMAVSMALMQVLYKEGGFDLAQSCRFCAGHSLGEYSALTAAQSLSLSDTARLVRLRGQAMQQAVPVGQGGMTAVIGMDYDQVDAVLKEFNQQNPKEICVAANDNAPGQIVISGHQSALAKLGPLLEQHGARGCIPLPVSAPFHSPLMQPAADRMAEALAEISLQPPLIPVISNITAQPVRDASLIKDLLVQQITGRVRWRETILTMVDQGVDMMVEIGPKKVLCGLAKRIAPSLTLVSIQGPSDIEQFLGQTLQTYREAS